MKSIIISYPMNRQWNILNWKVRGINTQTRWDDLRARIEESNCGIICIQETKRDNFDLHFLRNFSPRRFNQFAYSPSASSSGGIITIWNGSLFTGTVIDQSSFQITTKLTCNLSGNVFHITNVYGPCSNEFRDDFYHCLDSIDASNMDNWMLAGDFNLIISPLDINRPGGDTNNMLMFNTLIQQLDLVEVPLKGRNFTLSNMQDTPLLEKIDWIFTSAN